MGCGAEVWEGFFEGERVCGLHEHEGHAGSEEDDVGAREGVEFFALEVPGLGELLYMFLGLQDTDSCQNAIALVCVSKGSLYRKSRL